MHHVFLRAGAPAHTAGGIAWVWWTLKHPYSWNQHYNLLAILFQMYRAQSQNNKNCIHVALHMDYTINTKDMVFHLNAQITELQPLCTKATILLFLLCLEMRLYFISLNMRRALPDNDSCLIMWLFSSKLWLVCVLGGSFKCKSKNLGKTQGSEIHLWVITQSTHSQRSLMCWSVGTKLNSQSCLCNYLRADIRRRLVYEEKTLLRSTFQRKDFSSGDHEHSEYISWK